MSKLKSKDMQFHVNVERLNRMILDLRNICERQNDFLFISRRPLSLPSINQSLNTSLGRRSEQKIFILTILFAYARASNWFLVTSNGRCWVKVFITFVALLKTLFICWGKKKHIFKLGVFKRQKFVSVCLNVKSGFQNLKYCILN